MGNTEEITILDLASRNIDLTSSQSAIVQVPYDQAYEPGFEDMRRRVPSIEKIQRLTGFSPRYRLDDTLRRVIDYERERLATEKG